MKQSSSVPAFLSKLWTLVEDGDTNEFICWSQEGNSFLVLDEQRFAKEILPKFFKHNNMASFIRQLNMYGFRKVMHIDTGIVKQERDGPVEFQHPYFKHGQDDLLENIKRKVSNTRPEDNKIRQEDLTKILASVQSVHSKQENIDARLATLKRFLTLTVCFQSTVNSLNGVKNSEVSEDIIICDLTENEAEVTAEITEESPRAFEQGDVEIVEVELDSCGVLPAEMEVSTSNDTKPTEVAADVGQWSSSLDSSAPTSSSLDSSKPTSSSLDSSKPTSSSLDSSAPTSSALQLNKPSGLSLEDPMKMMDSILNENGAISQNINLLGKVELMDYLDSIDCSLEDFQAMLYGKQFGIDFDAVEENVSSKENLSQQNRSRTNDHNTDKQLIQYTSCPLLAFLDGCTPPSDLDLGSSSSSSHLQPSATSVETEPPSELLDVSLEAKQPPSSSLIRLEPLTEAEASEETLFYLCELSPAEAESSQLSRAV
ncbi:heat shock factor protein 2 [Stegastes partitus]|uniref:Heat shock factor protein 2 n=1 Tax=Stegastes partitus TaxID=144197 RepID=A0A9Y4KKX0_9TELE|nr:PREDICTED: heat shock factor protein 2 [Stegastes partitus]